MEWAAALIVTLTAAACQGRAGSELVIADSTAAPPSPVVAAAFVEQADSSYSRIGRLAQDSAGSYLIEQRGLETDTFRLEHTRFGWRIAGPVQHQHILPAAALSLRRVHDDTRSRLTELAGR